MALEVKNPPANVGHTRDVGLIPESGRFPEGGRGNLLQYSCLDFLPLSHGQRKLGGYSPWGHTDLDMTKQWQPLQYSCLENSMDGGAWSAAVPGVAASQTRLNGFAFTFHFHALEN